MCSRCSCVLRVCSFFPSPLPLHLLAHSSFIRSFSCPGGVVATTWHSVSSSLLYKVRSARH